MHLYRLVRTAQPEASFLAAASSVALLVKIFFLNRMPGAFPGAQEAGVLVEAILCSVIASYVFYLIVVHLKDRKEKAILYPFISKHASRIVGECAGQLVEISKRSEVPVALDDLSNLNDAFSKIPPYSDAPLIINRSLQYANWFQYFDFHNGRTKESIRRLLDQLPYLDAELVSLISAIDDCAHFWVVTTSLNNPSSNPNLEVWADPFLKYCQLCHELETYLNKWVSENAP
ncbi:hypothetical protein WCE55_05010 [Luteimonas sp. MJ293]|uniref:hypothetical protein n=1 Tax=Luteimonas sp. MJ146 TaxID=3129240 RepID=UPI0031BB58EE